MNLTYLSGPITDKPQKNRPAFEAAAKALRAAGHEVVNPFDVAPHAQSWEEAMRLDIAALVHCSRIAILPGWILSRGARLEKHIAEELGMEVIFLTAEVPS